MKKDTFIYNCISTAGQCLVIIVMTALCFGSALGQSEVNVAFVIKPPYSSYINDYAHLENKSIITLTNLTGAVKQVYLKGSITNISDGLYVRSGANYRPASFITLQPHQTTVITANPSATKFLDAGNTETNIVDPDKRNMARMAQLPEGIYQVCVQVYDYYSGALLSAQNGGCTTINITLAGPPNITSPVNEQTLPAAAVNNTVYSWTPPIGNLSGGRPVYDLIVVKVLPGQNPNDVISAARDYKANNPIIYKTGLTAQTYVAQPYDLKPEAGATYAMQVVARDANNILSFKNDGKSEIVVFTYEANKANTETTTTTTTKGKSIVNSTFTSKTQPLAPLEYYSFKGTLVWGYRKTEVSKVIPVLNNNTNHNSIPVTTTSYPGIPGMGHSGSSSTGNSGVTVGNGINTADKTSGKYVLTGTNLTPNEKAGLSLNSDQAAQDQIQKNINTLVADTKYPLAYTQVKIVKKIDPAFAKQYQQNSKLHPSLIPGKTSDTLQSEVLLATVTTDKDGNFSYDYYGNLGVGYYVQLQVAQGNFNFANTTMLLNTSDYGTYDLGTITGLAATYRYNLQVKDKNGKDMPNAHVQIMRPHQFYNDPKANINFVHELRNGGGPNATRTMSKSYLPDGYYISNQTYDIIAEGTPATLFTEVFFNNAADYGNEYYIYISVPGYDDDWDVMYASNSSTSITQDVIEIDAVHTMSVKAKSMIKGHVVAGAGAIPITNSTVVAHPNNMDYQAALNNHQGFSTTTDSKGAFKIENITSSGTPYILTVLYNGKPFTDHTDSFLLSTDGLIDSIEPLTINAALLTVCGLVTDVNSKAIDNATLYWQDGGQPFNTDANGGFYSLQTPGKHVLVVHKSGFHDVKSTIDVEPADLTKYLTTTTNDSKLGQKYFSGYINKSGTGSTAGSSSNNMGNGGLYSDASSCGHTIVLKGNYMKVFVSDAVTKQPIQNALVHSPTDKSVVKTNAKGLAILQDVPSGGVPIVVEGPSDGFYTTTSNNVYIDTLKDTFSVQIALPLGSIATGTITTKGGKAVAGAEVFVVGKEYITTTTNSSGVYELKGIITGEATIRAAKDGYISHDTVNTFVAKTTYTINLNIQDPGFNASTLLGFKLFLESSTPVADSSNEFMISGSIGGFKDNNVFKIEGDHNVKLSFHDVVVVKQPDNTIKLKEPEVPLDPGPISLFVYGINSMLRPMSNGSLMLRPKNVSNTTGEIAGLVQLSLGGVFTDQNFKMTSDRLTLINNGSNEIAGISSDGASSATTFSLSDPQNGSWVIYGIPFTPDLTTVQFNDKGLSVGGAVNMPGVPGLGNISIPISKITVTPGHITNLTLGTAPAISLGNGWKMQLSNVALQNGGLIAGGDITGPLGPANVDFPFSALLINPNGVSGGNINLPGSGLSLFGLASFNPGAALGLSPLAGGTGFKIGGSGGLNFSQYIPSAIPISNFSVGTDGSFSIVSQTGVSKSFDGVADITINKISLSNTGFDLNCGFSLGIPGLGSSGLGGDILYSNGGVTVNNLSAAFNLAGALGLNVGLTFSTGGATGDGFTGTGGLTIFGQTGINIPDFHYYKQNGNVNIGASFQVDGAVQIPLGPVAWSSITGSFNFDQIHSVYSIGGGGKFTFIADQAGALALTDVNVTVTESPSGLDIAGSGNATLFDSWNIASVSANIDFGNKNMHINGTFGPDFNLIKGLNLTAQDQVAIGADWGAGKYIFVSGSTTVNIPYICNTSVKIVAGWNAPTSADPSLGSVPQAALYNGAVFGGYFNASSTIGLLKDDAPTIGFQGIASLKVWCGESANLTVYGNVKSNNYGVSFSQNWDAGGQVDVIGITVTGDASLGGGLTASYNNGAWGMDGWLNGNLSASGTILGCNVPNCNSIGFTWGVPCCFNICAGAKMEITYNSGDGFHFHPSFF